jgi:hypothetical protein
MPRQVEDSLSFSESECSDKPVPRVTRSSSIRNNHSIVPTNSIAQTQFINDDSDDDQSISSAQSSVSSSLSWTSSDGKTFFCRWQNCSLSFSSMKSLQAHAHKKHLDVVTIDDRRNSQFINSFNQFLAACNLDVCTGNHLLPSGCKFLRLYKYNSKTSHICLDCIHACNSLGISLPNSKPGRKTKTVPGDGVSGDGVSGSGVSGIGVSGSGVSGVGVSGSGVSGVGVSGSGSGVVLGFSSLKTNSLQNSRSSSLSDSDDVSYASQVSLTSQASVRLHPDAVGNDASDSGSIGSNSIDSGHCADPSGSLLHSHAVGNNEHDFESAEFGSHFPANPANIAAVANDRANAHSQQIHPNLVSKFALSVNNETNSISAGDFHCTMDELLLLSRSPIQSIPNSVIEPIAEQLCLILDDMTNNVEHSEYLYQLFCSVIFSASPERDSSLKSIIKFRLDLWRDGNLSEFCSTIPHFPLATQPRRNSADEMNRQNLDLRTQRYIRNLINSDECSKAFRTATTDLGLADISQANFLRLQEKFAGEHVPSLDPAHLLYRERDGKISITSKEMMSSANKMALSAAGPDGMNTSVLKQLLTNSSNFVNSLTKFINSCLAGTIRRNAGTMINASRLIGIWKDALQSDVRPITIGTAIRRLTARCTLSYVIPLAEQTFGKDQYGAGTQNGTEKPIHLFRHLMQSALESTDDFVVMSRDAKNAFNEIDQNQIFAGVSECMPKLSNYLRWVYGSNAPQMFGDVGKLHMRAGVFQGDPLSALLFCFIPRKIWLQLTAQTNICGVDIQWNKIHKALYLDDTIIAGPSSQVFAIAQGISNVGLSMGFITVPKKDQIARPNPLCNQDHSALQYLNHLFDSDGALRHGASLPTQCGMNYAVEPAQLEMPTGLKMLGAFVSPVATSDHPDVDESGAVEFVKQEIESTLLKHLKLRRVSQYQDRLILLRMCASSMVVLSHIARTHPPHILESAGINRVDVSVYQMVLDMMQDNNGEIPEAPLSNMTFTGFAQLHPFAPSFFDSSLQDGGLGLRAISQHRSSAFIASVVATLRHTKERLNQKFVGDISLGDVTRFNAIQSLLIDSAIKEFNSVVGISDAMQFISDNLRSNSRYIPRSSVPLQPLTFSLVANDALNSQRIRFQQRVLSRTIDLGVRYRLLQRASQHVAVDQGYALMRLQHVDANSVLFLQAKPDIRKQTLLTNMQIQFGLQFYTDTLKSLAFRNITHCNYSVDHRTGMFNKPIERHSIVWCQKAGENTQRHEDLVHAITAAINVAPNNHNAIANVNLAYSNNRAGSNLNSAEPQVLKPADILVDRRDLIDVTVVDPRTKLAIQRKYFQTPLQVMVDAIQDKQRKYNDVVQRDNRHLSVFAFSHFGKPHYYTLKVLKKLFASTSLVLRRKNQQVLHALRIQISLICFRRAANCVENHLRFPEYNVQDVLQHQVLLNRESNRILVE